MLAQLAGFPRQTKELFAVGKGRAATRANFRRRRKRGIQRLRGRRANIFNLVLVSGASVTLAPFEVPVGNTLFGINASLVLDIPLMIVVMALLTLPALLRKKLGRWQGITLLAIYAAFCVVQFAL